MNAPPVAPAPAPPANAAPPELRKVIRQRDKAKTERRRAVDQRDRLGHALAYVLVYLDNGEHEPDPDLSTYDDVKDTLRSVLLEVAEPRTMVAAPGYDELHYIEWNDANGDLVYSLRGRIVFDEDVKEAA